MLITATKYIEDSIQLRKMFILVKNPIKGGNPAIEKSTVLKIRAIIRLVFSIPDRSDKSLLCFFLVSGDFTLNNRKIDHRHELANI